MGAWGPGILQDDVALDVQRAFEEAFSQGMTAEAATQYVLTHAPWNLEDEDDRTTTFLALATLLLRHEVIQEDVRNQSLAAITSGLAISRWEGASPDKIAARASVLERLQVALKRGKCTPDELDQITGSKAHAIE